MEWFTTLLRQLIVALVTSAVIVVALIVAFQGQSAHEREVMEQTLSANLAIACVLALPVDPETGRDDTAVRNCFTQYELEAPRLQSNG